MSQSSTIGHVVVLGGGYAGLRVAVDLAAACRRHGLDRRISLVDRTSHHQLVTSLHRGATEGVDVEACRLPLAELLVPETVEGRTATVTALRPKNRALDLDDGPPLRYDRLVVALGSVPAEPAIDGLQEHCFRLRWWSDAVRLRDHVRQVFEGAARPRASRAREGLLTLVVAGGGATGCQLAGELAHWMPKLADEHRIGIDEIRLLLVEAGPRLLREDSPEASRYAQETLTRKGVEVRLSTHVESVAAGSVGLGGERVATETVVWTGGVQAPTLLAASGLPVAQQGRVKVDSQLRAEGFPEVYVAGDAAHYEHRGEPLPATAAMAQHQGAYIASAIVSEMLGRPNAAYRPRDLGRIVSLGGDDAVGTMLGLPLQGSGAGFVKENIERWYEATVTRRLPLMDL